MKKILKICITLSFTFLLTGCVDCLVSLNYSKIKKPTLYGELTIEPQILEKYSMSISQIKKQLLDYDFFKDWAIKKQTDSSLSIESPTSFIKEISTLTKQNNKYILSIDIPKNMLDTSELNHYKNTLQLLNSSNATCSFKITMPGTIISSNVGKYQQNVVTINLFELLINMSIESCLKAPVENRTVILKSFEKANHFIIQIIYPNDSNNLINLNNLENLIKNYGHLSTKEIDPSLSLLITFYH